MKTKLTQKQRIEKRLLDVGHISRNECIRNYITRLSAYILELKEEGWEFETKDTGHDYYYKVVKHPYKQIIRTLSNGEVIKTLVK